MLGKFFKSKKEKTEEPFDIEKFNIELSTLANNQLPFVQNFMGNTSVFNPYGIAVSWDNEYKQLVYFDSDENIKDLKTDDIYKIILGQISEQHKLSSNKIVAIIYLGELKPQDENQNIDTISIKFFHKQFDKCVGVHYPFRFENENMQIRHPYITHEDKII